MFEYQQGPTGLHKIENPGQVILVAVLIIATLIGLSLVAGYYVSKA